MLLRMLDVCLWVVTELSLPTSHPMVNASLAHYAKHAYSPFVFWLALYTFFF
jgi:hypothetical protein